MTNTQEKECAGKRRRTGRVARMPKVLRDEINRMLEDGRPYEEIRSRALEEGYEIQKWNVTEWRQGGHQDWLRERDRLEEMRLIREFAQDIVRENQGKDVQEAGIQIATTHIYELLLNFDPTTLKAKVKGDPANYARMVMALAKLSDGGLKFARYRAEVEQAKAAIEKELEKMKEGGLSEEAITRMEEALNMM
jgi:hypothetical protein